MSYVHCPDCNRAYHLGKDRTCPRCVAPERGATPIAVTAIDPVADIVLAATHLARALARATPAQRLAARASLGLVQEHIVSARPPTPARAMLNAIASRGPLLATAALGLVARRLFGR